MTPEAFDALARLMRQRPDSQGRELARLVLVEGLTQNKAADRLGAARQAAGNAVRAARAALALAQQAAGAVTAP